MAAAPVAAAVVLAVKGVTLVILNYSTGWLYLSDGWRQVVGALAGVTMGAALLASPFVRRNILAGALLLSPQIALAFGHGIWRARTRAGSPEPPFAAALAASPARARVLWIIFDEWDFGVTFSAAKPDGKLPEVERFRRQSLFASRARSPNRVTLYSMPALVTGRAVRRSVRSSDGHVKVQFAGDSGWTDWATQANVFESARRLGYNVAATGAGINYCTEFGASFTSCQSFGDDRGNASFGEYLLAQTRGLFETQWRSFFGQSVSARSAANIYRRVRQSSLPMAADKDFGFVLLHFPIPHPPYFFDRVSGKMDWPSTPFFSAFASRSEGYQGNLALMDIALRAVRESMQRSGVWDSTAVLISSDHAIKTRPDGDPMLTQVPFLLKMPAQQQPTTFDEPIDALVSEKLLLAILSGELKTVADVPPWLQRHRTDFPPDRPIYPASLSETDCSRISPKAAFGNTVFSHGLLKHPPATQIRLQHFNPFIHQPKLHRIRPRPWLQSSNPPAHTTRSRRIRGRHRDRLRQRQPRDLHQIADAPVHPQTGAREARSSRHPHALIRMQLHLDLTQHVPARFAHRRHHRIGDQDTALHAFRP